MKKIPWKCYENNLKQKKNRDIWGRDFSFYSSLIKLHPEEISILRTSPFLNMNFQKWQFIVFVHVFKSLISQKGLSEKLWNYGWNYGMRFILFYDRNVWYKFDDCDSTGSGSYNATNMAQIYFFFFLQSRKKCQIHNCVVYDVSIFSL